MKKKISNKLKKIIIKIKILYLKYIFFRNY